MLRAGLVLLEQAATVLPAAQTFHVGYVRDDATLQVLLVVLFCFVFFFSCCVVVFCLCAVGVAKGREQQCRVLFSCLSTPTARHTHKKHTTTKNQASSYLNKLPATLSADDLILVADPMLATGGTMLQVLADIVARGADTSNIRVVAVVAAPPALKQLSERYPGACCVCLCWCFFVCVFVFA